MDDKKIVFALDIGTRSVVGIVGALKDGNFNILDYEQEFHEKRAMRDGQIEDIDLVSRVANNVKRKLEQRTGQTFTKVSIAAAGRALRTAAASFSYDLIPNQPISSKIIQYMEYSAIEKAQEIFLSDSPEQESSLKDYYCVGYSVTDYLLDDYKIKNLEGQKGKKAVVDIIAAFLPASVLISLYAVTARCGLEVDNLTLEPIAAIHAVVPDDVRFLNIALVDIGGGTSDIAISRDGSVIAYDMVTIAGDEITEALMQHYLTNFATAEHIKLMLSSDEPMEFKDILGNEISLTPDEAYEAVREPIHALAEAISQRILLINGSAPAAVFLVGGGSQIKGLCKIVADKLGMAANRVAVGVVNTENNLSLFSDSLYSPTFVTPIGIGIVSSLYRGCDFFAISVNGKRIMLFNHQTIKVLDALMFAGIKPSSLIGLTPPNLVYTLNGVKKTVKGTPGMPGELLVNGTPATIETEIKQGDEITATLAKNGTPPALTLRDAIGEFDLKAISMIKVNDMPINFHDVNTLDAREISYMDQLEVIIASEMEETDHQILGFQVPTASAGEVTTQNIDSAEPVTVEINKIHSHSIDQPTVSLLLADEPEEELPANQSAVVSEPENSIDNINSKAEITVTLNGSPVHLVQETNEPLILMHLLKYVDLDVANPRGELILKINGVDANYADPINNHDVAVIKWSEDM
ncbi:MAG: cell division protein FtsA [Clostridiales bacterium]|jgi:cell division protein FtsA|nr:cell division protein FtsA [Clostridiales bacterium]